MAKTTTADSTGKTSSRRAATERRPRQPAMKVTRLSININEETEDALRQIADRRGISITETVRRAVSIAKLIEDAIDAGSTIQIDDGTRVRELMLV